ncbi:hypothetical protein ABIB17_003503 [Arthrobacter sp. UYEF6]
MSTTFCAHQQQPSPPLDPVHNWTELQRTEAVELFRHDLTTTSGHIDLCSLDVSALWILQDHGPGRIMIHRSMDSPSIRSVAEQHLGATDPEHNNSQFTDPNRSRRTLAHR